jgi:hypothetical protein
VRERERKREGERGGREREREKEKFFDKLLPFYLQTVKSFKV